MSLPEILRGARFADNRLTAAIPADWMQGRTGYGGLTAALALEAALRAQPDLPPLRSAQIGFIGPVSNEIEVSVRLLRRGRTAAFIEAELSCAGQLGLKALFIFMTALDSAIDHAGGQAPAAPAPEDAVPVRPHPDPTFFTRQLDYRYAAPKRDTREPDLLRWVRLAERENLHPMVELMAIGDALPPAAMALFDKPGPISSMSWMINILAAEPQTRDGWYLTRSTADHARHGSSSQLMQLWTTDGHPVAEGMQSVAIFV